VTAIKKVSSETIRGCRRGSKIVRSFFKIRVCARKATPNFSESINFKFSGLSHAQRIKGGKSLRFWLTEELPKSPRLQAVENKKVYKTMIKIKAGGQDLKIRRETVELNINFGERLT
jgi:hypothetical protein